MAPSGSKVIATPSAENIADGQYDGPRSLPVKDIEMEDSTNNVAVRKSNNGATGHGLDHVADTGRLQINQTDDVDTEFD